MDSILKFKGNWRTYQNRVLLHGDEYLKDGKIHIVAAPGSGKTTLGIELIGRMNKPALIFAPTITIREQWIDRIKEGFLADGIVPEEWISNNLKKPKFITVATYQSLYAAMTRTNLASSKALQQEIDKESEQEYLAKDQDTEDFIPSPYDQEDYSDYKIIETMRDIGLGVICLDECHHLRKEWWSALEKLKKEFPQITIISLTATPPYDDSPAMWKRYIEMCGEIDEEITIPELVKENSLCPHQDYVMFNYPTKEEKDEIDLFRQRSKNMVQNLMSDKSFEEIVKSNKSLFCQQQEDVLLENPGYLSSILIYLEEKDIPYPKKLLKLLGAKKLPSMDSYWMEKLLQGLLYDDVNSFMSDACFRDQLEAELKRNGLLEKKKVCMTDTKEMEKILASSKGKIESIKKIAEVEYTNLGKELRMLVLTDYIKKENLKNIGNLQTDMNQLGVVPFFEVLRRQAEEEFAKYKDAKKEKVRLGLLCGSLVIIPGETKSVLIQLMGEDKVTFFQAGQLEQWDYVVVKPVGKGNLLTAAVTELFSQGHIQILLGTKSLLGEGWDAPCVNSLILASFVGSYMLSNQMRGRAIRVDKDNVNKTSNIWHLVCITPEEVGNERFTGEYSPDYIMLTRRMEHFLGLHYEDNTIENGIGRLSVITHPFNRGNVKSTNEKMLKQSKQRDKLMEGWKNALAICDDMQMVEEVDISNKFISFAMFFDAIKTACICMGLTLLFLFVIFSANGVLSGVVMDGLAILFGAGSVFYFAKAVMLSSPLRRLKLFGEGVRSAMVEKGMLNAAESKVCVLSNGKIVHGVYLKGGSGKEKSDFANMVCNFFDEIDNQRYILVKPKKTHRLDDYFVVPEAFSKNKEDAEIFAKCISRFTGKYELVYTRNEVGRKILLEGRLKAFANKQERTLRKKKVKNALE